MSVQDDTRRLLAAFKAIGDMGADYHWLQDQLAGYRSRIEEMSMELDAANAELETLREELKTHRPTQ